MIEEEDYNYEECPSESDAYEYGRYMDVLVSRLAKTAVSVMAIAQECGCESYEHIMKGYKIRVCRWEDDEE